jgi:hypothetical protein
MLTFGDFKEIEAAGAHVGLAEGHDGDGEQRAAQRDDGREQIERAVDAGGDDVFFEEGFCAIDQRLQQAEGAHAAGSPAVLDAAHQLALKQHGVSDAHEQHHRDHGYFEQAPQEELENRHVRSASLICCCANMVCRHLEMVRFGGVLPQGLKLLESVQIPSSRKVG